MSKLPSVHVVWTDSKREIRKAEAEGRDPQRIASIRFCWYLEDGTKRHRFNRTLGLTSETEANRVQATIADTLAIGRNSRPLFGWQESKSMFAKVGSIGVYAWMLLSTSCFVDSHRVAGTGPNQHSDQKHTAKHCPLYP